MENLSFDKTKLNAQIEKYKKELMSTYSKSETKDFPPRESENGIEETDKPVTRQPPSPQPPTTAPLPMPKFVQLSDPLTADFNAIRKPEPEAPLVLPVQNNLAVTKDFETLKAEHPATSKIRTQVFTARETYPLACAVVEISKKFDSGKYVVARIATDRSGQTTDVVVPAALRKLSETPGDAHPYLTYNISVELENYLPAYIEDVPVFEDVLSLQTVMLVPSGAATAGQSDTEYTTTEPDL